MAIGLPVFIGKRKEGMNHAAGSISSAHSKLKELPSQSNDATHFLALMDDLLVASSIAGCLSRETMGKSVGIDEGGHGTKKRLPQGSLFIAPCQSALALPSSQFSAVTGLAMCPIALSSELRRACLVLNATSALFAANCH